MRTIDRIELEAKMRLRIAFLNRERNPRINHEQKVIFIHIPKTAGTSVIKALNSLSTKPHKLFPKMETHARAAEVRAVLGKNVWNDYFSFTFVRNPWAMMVSSYHWWLQKAPCFRGRLPRLAHKVACMNGFDEFIRSSMGRYWINEVPGEIIDWICDCKGNQLVNYVGRVEQIDRDWEHIGKLTGLPLPKLPYLNNSNHKDYRFYYDDETCQLVAERFKWSIEHYGYKF